MSSSASKRASLEIFSQFRKSMETESLPSEPSEGRVTEEEIEAMLHQNLFRENNIDGPADISLIKQF